MSDAIDDGAPKEAEPRGIGIHYFQIQENDLADLERDLPQIADAMMPHLNPRLRTKWRRVQTILSNVRWNYGPPTNVTVTPVDGGLGPPNAT